MGLFFSQTTTMAFAKTQERSPHLATEIYQNAYQAVVEIKAYDKNGGELVRSGFFIEEGKVLTSYHNIEGRTDIQVYGYDKTEYSVVSVFGYHKKYDLAILEVDGKSESFLPLSKEPIQTGMSIYTIGSPYGYTGSFSSGIVSYADRVLDGVSYIQFTAPTSMGSGGSPLLNQYGEVVGVNSRTIMDAQNVNFAISIGKLKNVKTVQPIQVEDFYEKNQGWKTSFDLVEKDVTLYDSISPSIVEITGTNEKYSYVGTGFFIGPRKIVTNYHVLEPLTKLEIKDKEGKRYTVNGVYDYSKNDDLVILHVKEKGVPLPLADMIPTPGTTVYTIGSVLGLTGTFSKGIIASSSRMVEKVTCVQITVPIFSGNSGGPLFNEKGEVVGVCAFGYGKAQNINFAIQVSNIRKMNLKTWKPL